ncbi:C39 family peptidase [Bifidobacterium sp. ESL0775]|uniref:C39 family peptidase n=1 Tax=Bifidobacterium sp. ESL0775 TaxID=2983230 RepID=UPI0023F90356|nr:C39 family peptidase [Bifidobacterium sp. ESL0775]WEV68588.1 C39 family peptidase [Bifidobacterium sp. ESL0775]
MLVYYRQNDPRWANKLFGQYPITDSGCGPSSMAMILTYLLDRPIAADKVATKVPDACTGHGCYHDLAERLSYQYPIDVHRVPNDVSIINQILDSGGLIWTCGHGHPPFTDYGHSIGIRGRTKRGRWLVFDSAFTRGHLDHNRSYKPAKLIRQMNDATTAVYRQSLIETILKIPERMFMQIYKVQTGYPCISWVRFWGYRPNCVSSGGFGF